MNSRSLQAVRCLVIATALLAVLLSSGCSTTSGVNWDDRVGVYTYEAALAEFGMPTSLTEMQGGVKAAEWVTSRTGLSATPEPPPAYTRGETLTPNMTYGSSAPNKVLRLMFTPDGKLLDWQRNY